MYKILAAIAAAGMLLAVSATAASAAPQRQDSPRQEQAPRRDTAPASRDYGDDFADDDIPF